MQVKSLVLGTVILNTEHWTQGFLLQKNGEVSIFLFTYFCLLVHCMEHRLLTTVCQAVLSWAFLSCCFCDSLLCLMLASRPMPAQLFLGRHFSLVPCGFHLLVIGFQIVWLIHCHHFCFTSSSAGFSSLHSGLCRMQWVILDTADEICTCNLQRSWTLLEVINLQYHVIRRAAIKRNLSKEIGLSFPFFPSWRLGSPLLLPQWCIMCVFLPLCSYVLVQSVGIHGSMLSVKVRVAIQ